MEESLRAIFEEQKRGLQQQHLRFVEEFDRRNQQMITWMLELLREVVNEEEEVSKDDCCDEQHSLADAHQVFDESPQKDSHDVAHGGSLMLVNPSEKGLSFVVEQSLPFQELGLSGCEGGYEGIRVIGQCYEMLLTLSAPRMEGGWMVLEELSVEHCQMQDKVTCIDADCPAMLTHLMLSDRDVQVLARFVFDPGGSLLGPCTLLASSRMQEAASYKNNDALVGLVTTTAHVEKDEGRPKHNHPALSLEDKALKGGALMQGFSIIYFSLSKY